MRRPNLIIARVGRQSLHSTWLNAAADRNWDLYLCPYQPLPGEPDERLMQGEVLPGPKWTGLRQLLESWDGWRAYERVWLPDDDLLASQDTINRFFDIAKAAGLELCAPALHENSYFAHFSTMRNRRSHVRRTGFVEIMAPCFSTRALSLLLPSLALSSTGWGWGLDSLWPRQLDYQNIGVVDATPVLHTRAVGAFRDAELDRRVRAESDAIMERFACRQVHTTFAMLGPDLAPIDLPAEGLASELAEGWHYLWRAHPQLLTYILDAQRPPGGWNAYPIEGTPACAAV